MFFQDDIGDDHGAPEIKVMDSCDSSYPGHVDGSKHDFWSQCITHSFIRILRQVTSRYHVVRIAIHQHVLLCKFVKLNLFCYNKISKNDGTQWVWLAKHETLSLSEHTVSLPW